jgi:hypothetical protein
MKKCIPQDAAYNFHGHQMKWWMMLLKKARPWRKSWNAPKSTRRAGVDILYGLDGRAGTPESGGACQGTRHPRSDAGTYGARQSVHPRRVIRRAVCDIKARGHLEGLVLYSALLHFFLIHVKWCHRVPLLW